MSRLHLKLPLTLALAAGLGVSACSDETPSMPADVATRDVTPVASGGMQPPSPVAEANVHEATASTSTEPGSMQPSSADTSASTTFQSKVMPGALPLLVVTKTPTCGCCHLWVEHMKKAGFPVEIHDVEDMGPAKERAGVPYGKGSCHTAEVGGYFVEGHVPAEDVKRLLAERPDAKGLTLPGMPLGSPGMEMPDGRVQPYVVELVAKDGSTSPYANHGP